MRDKTTSTYNVLVHLLWAIVLYAVSIDVDCEISAHKSLFKRFMMQRARVPTFFVLSKEKIVSSLTSKRAAFIFFRTNCVQQFCVKTNYKIAMSYQENLSNRCFLNTGRCESKGGSGEHRNGKPFHFADRNDWLAAKKITCRKFTSLSIWWNSNRF